LGDLVVHKQRDLKETLEIYNVLKACCSEVMEWVKRDPAKFASKLAQKTSRAPGDPSYSKKSLAELFDNTVTPTLDEVCFIDLVRVFERIVFDLVDNASGQIRRVIEKGSKEKYPFHLYADKFVKVKETDIGNLGDVQKILQGRIDRDLENKLTNIVKYRNWLAHGKRFADKPSWPGTIAEVLEILEEVLTKIRPFS
jgi:hypothetical protein